jgi:hypothetical protein
MASPGLIVAELNLHASYFSTAGDVGVSSRVCLSQRDHPC